MSLPDDHPVFEKYTQEHINLATKVGHNVIKAATSAFGPEELPQWEFCHPDYRDRLERAVVGYLLQGRSCRNVHSSFVRQLQDKGFVLGEKDWENKTHPHLMDFNDLPVEVRTIQKIFRACIMGFRDNLGPGFHDKK